jgi:hypothetical protein
MTLPRWASLLLAATAVLFGQRADASRTPLTDIRAAITQPQQLTAPAADAATPADAWLVESITPLGHTDDGQPLVLISLLIPTAHLAEHTPASTRAGPYAAPKTHTRVFYIGQPPLGLFTIDEMMESYVDKYGEDAGLRLFLLLSSKDAGGGGWTVQKKSHKMNDWSVDAGSKTIFIDDKHLGLVDRSGGNAAKQINDALYSLGAGEWTFWLGTKRFGSGVGDLAGGTIETVIGGIGIVVPEPGSTAGGIAVGAIGLSNMGEGVSKMWPESWGGSRGGYNPLREGAAGLGYGLAYAMDKDPEAGANIGRMTYNVGSIAVSLRQSYKILKVPDKPFLQKNLGGQPGGYAIGRLQGLYESANTAGGGKTLFSIVNNADQSILRIVSQGGKLHANIRIVGQMNKRHVTDGVEITKALLKLAVHGAKF